MKTISKFLQEALEVVPMIKKTEIVSNTISVCPHCNQEIQEKSMFCKEIDGEYYCWHRPCMDKEPIQSLNSKSPINEGVVLENIDVTKDIEMCPHCQTKLKDGHIKTKELNGTYYYYHQGCKDCRPIAIMPMHSNPMLRNLWYSTKDAKNPIQ